MENATKTPKKKATRKRSASASRSGSVRGSRAAASGGNAQRGGRSGGIGDWLSKTGQREADAGSNISMPQLGNIESAIENRPVMLGAVGIAIGMVIGAMLPSMTNMMHMGSSSSRSRATTRH